MKKLIGYIKDSWQRFNTARWNAGLTRKYFPESKYVVEHAFTIAGMEYFQYNDISTLPYERGLMALAIYEEARMGCDREYLEKHCEAIDDILSQNNINIFAVKTLNEQMRQRLDISLNADILYKLASVIFFDRNENPVLYDPAYCRTKIEFWKQHKGMADFFLQLPVTQLMPFLELSDSYLQSYLELSMAMNEAHLENFHTLKSKSSSTDLKTGKKRSKA